MPLSYEEKMIRAIKFNEERKAGIFASQIATKDKIKLEELSTDDIQRLVSIYDQWEVGVSYSAGDLVAYQDSLFEVIQAHTSQADWTPDATASLFKSFAPVGTIPLWTQPAGAHDAYQIGDKVEHNSQIWISVAADNVWEPGVFGWEVSTA